MTATGSSKGAVPKTLRSRQPLFQRHRRVATGALAEATRSLAVLLEARISLVRALQTVESQLGHRHLQDVYQAVRKDVEAGKSLSRALGNHSHVFPPLYVQLVHAGEQAGILGQILSRLAAYLEKAHAVRRRIQSALAYPALVLAVAVAATAFLLVVIVPTFADMYRDYGADLPAPTRLLLRISSALTTHFWFFVAGGFGVVVGFRAAVRRPVVRAALDRLALRLPIAGPVVRISHTARFARMLGVMLQNRVPLLDALAILRRSTTFTPLITTVRAVEHAVERGGGVSSPMAADGLLTPMIVQMIAVGEESGELDDMLLHVAAHQEAELDQRTNALLSLLEPVLILTIGILLGGILVALYLPLFDLSQVVG